MEDLVSIITPTYNAEKFIKYTIESVLEQEYKNWELIIVDDCSKDNTKDIVASYMKNYDNIKFICLESNGGVANARNVGIKIAKGKYIAFLDSDDLWHHDKLSKQIAFMKENDYAFTYTAYEWINEEGSTIGKRINIPMETDYKKLLRGNIIGCLTVVIDREKVQKIEMPLIKHEDYAAWLKILKNGIKAYGIDENLALYRRTANSVSSNKIKTITWTWNILRKNEQLSILRSTRYMAEFFFSKIFKYVT